MRKLSRSAREEQLHGLLNGTLFTFVEWPDGFTNNKSRVTLNCPKHGDWSTGFTNVLKGTRCSKCRLEDRTHNENDVISLIESRLKKGQRFISFKGGYENNYSRATLQCEKHGIWECSALHIIHSGSGCRKCGHEMTGFKRSTPLNVVIERLSNIDDYEFVGFENGYKNSNSKVLLKCSKHGKWVTTVASVSSNRHGCPSCSKNGFDPSSKGYLYLLKSKCSELFKVGITNNIKRRVVELKRVTPFEFTILDYIKSDGCNVIEIEKAFHKYFNNANMKGFNGSTEWFTWDDSVVEWFKLF